MNKRILFSLLFMFLSIAILSTAQLPTRLKSINRALFQYGPAPHFQSWDSTYYVYSGKRGSDLKANIIKFDTAWHYTFDINLTPIPANRTIQAFDNNSNIITITEQQWNNNQWENTSQKQYTYNGSLPADVTESVWNINQWLQSAKHTYHYSGTQLDSISYFVWVGTSWAEGNPTHYHYTNNLLDTITDFDHRTIYEYDINGTLIKTIFQSLPSTSWVNKNQFIYQYNSVADNDTIFIQEWDNNAWLNKKRVEITYDTKDNVLTSLSNSWNVLGNDWEPMESHTAPLNSTVDTLKTYHYELIPDKVSEVKNISISVYPVPANNIINVQGNNGHSIDLFNSDGKKVLSGYSPLHVANLPSGVYYLNGDGRIIPILITR